VHPDDAINIGVIEQLLVRLLEIARSGLGGGREGLGRFESLEEFGLRQIDAVAKGLGAENDL
jgi:hypothetical protein